VYIGKYIRLKASKEGSVEYYPGTPPLAKFTRNERYCGNVLAATKVLVLVQGSVTNEQLHL